MTNLGVMARGHDRAEALRWLGQAGSLGDARALKVLGDIYYKTDKPQAQGYYERAAEAGSTEAMWVLAKLNKGNLPEARRRYLEQAAGLGHAGSMRTLGTMAIRNKDYDEAIRWFRLAAAAGNDVAPELVRILHFTRGRGPIRALCRECLTGIVDLANLWTWLAWQARRLMVRRPLSRWP
jgi:TPR repeat protein